MKPRFEYKSNKVLDKIIHSNKQLSYEDKTPNERFIINYNDQNDLITIYDLYCDQFISIKEMKKRFFEMIQ